MNARGAFQDPQGCFETVVNTVICNEVYINLSCFYHKVTGLHYEFEVFFQVISTAEANWMKANHRLPSSTVNKWSHCGLDPLGFTRSGMSKNFFWTMFSPPVGIYILPWVLWDKSILMTFCCRKWNKSNVLIWSTTTCLCWQPVFLWNKRPAGGNAFQTLEPDSSTNCRISSGLKGIQLCPSSTAGDCFWVLLLNAEYFWWSCVWEAFSKYLPSHCVGIPQ